MIFRNWVLQNFPFLEDDFDALTDYELFCKMVEYMKESLEQIKGFQNEINILSSKLDEFQHYFDNLDVQEEINNKLDEMAESGELSDIIAQYLGLAGVLVFDTVSNMKTAENLVNGSIAKTLGYSSIQDNGGGYYKIRTITNDDTVDESFIIALDDNTLIAELIIPTILNISTLGVTENTDISTILQRAIDKTNIMEINLLGKSFEIDDTIELKSNFKIKNGVLTCVELTNSFECTEIENFTIDNIEFDGNNTSQRGIYLSLCNNFVISNCKFHDFEILTGTSCGINPHSCKFGLITNCEAYDIGNETVGDDHYEPRGFVIENSTNMRIDRCYIHDIYTPGNHGDGIHFDSPINRELSKNIVTNTVIEDCIYRGVKIQQRGIVIDNCKIIEGTNDRTLQQSAIAIYDSDIIIKNNYISQKCDCAITIGSTSDVTSVANNITIQNNTFDFKNSVYYGVITLSNLHDMTENLNIIGNNFNITDTNKKPYSIQLLGKFNRINIVDNMFKGGEVFVMVKKATGATSQSKNNLVVCNNSGTTKQSLVIFDDNAEISNGTITGNTCYYDTPLQFVSGQNSVRASDVTLYKTFKIGNNHISSSDNSIFFYDGPRSIGGTSSRPSTAVINGFQYFDTTLHQIVIYYNGSWYLPDGTVSS